MTPVGFFGFMLLPVWLIVVGVLLSRGTLASPRARRALDAAPAG